MTLKGQKVKEVPGTKFSNAAHCEVKHTEGTPTMAARDAESFGKERAMRSGSFREVLFAIAALLVSFTCASPVRAQTPGLVAAYGFAEGAGTTVADSSGNNN